MRSGGAAAVGGECGGRSTARLLSGYFLQSTAVHTADGLGDRG